MSIRYFAYAVILFILSGCQAADKSNLSQDPIIRETFSPNDIKYLVRILDLYQDKILSEFPEESDFILAYQRYLQGLCDFHSIGDALSQINESNYNEIYELMKESGLFDSLYPLDTIFVDSNGTKSNSIKSDSIYRITRTIPRVGKYVEFLNELSVVDTIFAYHYNTLMLAGGTPPSYLLMMFCWHDRYNLHDPKIQIFFIVTLLQPLWFSH